MTKIVNLTPHVIVIEGMGEIPPSGSVARVTTREETVGNLNGVPLVRRSFGEIEGLPAPQQDTMFLVSSMVLSAIKNRKDVLAPDTGPTAKRDQEGRIKAVTRLIAL